RQKRRAARAEALRDEACALDPDVPAGAETGVDDGARPTAGIDRDEASADLVRRDQLAGEATEGTRSDSNPARHPGRLLRDPAHTAPAIDRVDVGGTVDPRSDQQAMTEAPDLVDRDPVGERAGGKRGGGARLAARVDHDDAGRSHRERVDVVP